jgi:murein DD-endopeptidase MepM/ murein hydrolase activator NlpD
MWRRSPRLIALLVVLVTGSLAVTLAPGASAQQTDKQRQLQQQIDESSKAVTDARAQAQGLQTDKARLDATLSGLDTQLAGAQSAADAAQARVDQLGFAAALLSARIDTTQQKLEQAQADAKASAVLLYKGPTNSGVMDLIGSTDGAGEVVEAQRYLERVGDKRRNDLARADRLRKVLDGQKAELGDQQAAAAAARDAAAATQQQIESLVTQQQQARGALADTEARLDSTVSSLTTQIAQDEADYAAESAAVTSFLQSLPAAGGTSGSDGGGGGGGSGTFLRPVPGSISSGFGYRTDPVTGAQAFHAGIDLAAPCGTPIKAAGNGTVVLVGWDPSGYGNYVVINHGGGLATLYGHQSAVAAANGQVVTAGQVIGYVGSTGKSTGCHLHFEVRVNGNPVNPLGYL